MNRSLKMCLLCIVFVNECEELREEQGKHKSTNPTSTP